jgi:hypothetical protein
LKLQYDAPLSNFAFNFNSRRYNPALLAVVSVLLEHGKAVQVDPITPTLKAPGN